MPSLDNIYDFIEKFEEDNFDFVLILNQPGKKTDLTDLFISIKNKNSISGILFSLEDALNQIQSLEFDEDGNPLEEIDDDEGYDEDDNF